MLKSVGMFWMSTWYFNMKLSIIDRDPDRLDQFHPIKCQVNAQLISNRLEVREWEDRKGSRCNIAAIQCFSKWNRGGFNIVYELIHLKIMPFDDYMGVY